MGDKSRDLITSDRTHFDKSSLPFGKEYERLTPYVIRKLWVGEERKEMEEELKEVVEEEEVDIALTSTSKLHQVGLVVRGELWLTVFLPPRLGW